MSESQDVQMCECCGLVPGVQNSKYLFLAELISDEFDTGNGLWVCESCEDQAFDDWKEWAKDKE